ncbi:MAG: hypothetical protein ABIK83_11305, partial [Candidatus Zixiibacteriota bacterium]
MVSSNFAPATLPKRRELRNISIISCILFCILTVALTPIVNAERATPSEMQQVCQNWIAEITYSHGSWAGETAPAITFIDEIMM